MVSDSELEARLGECWVPVGEGSHRLVVGGIGLAEVDDPQVWTDNRAQGWYLNPNPFDPFGECGAPTTEAAKTAAVEAVVDWLSPIIDALTPTDDSA